jgi:hypothetical protein
MQCKVVRPDPVFPSCSRTTFTKGAQDFGPGPFFIWRQEQEAGAGETKNIFHLSFDISHLSFGTQA